MIRSAVCVLSAVILVLLLMPFGGCQSSPALSVIQVTPASAALTVLGETVQFKATGTFVHAGHPSASQDITSQVTWASSNSGVATISSSGVAIAVSIGSTTITATMNSSSGPVAGSASLGVSGQAAHDLVSIAVIPATQPVVSIGEPSQFIAIGTFNTPPNTLDLTDQVTWQSSDVKVATINSTGLALGNDFGITTITAIGKSGSGAAIAGSATLNEGPVGGGVVLPALTVYAVGLGTGTVVSNPLGINCTAGAGCAGNFVLGATVTLTATPAAGSTFGGWSANCLPDTANSCTLVINNNTPVGAIFN
jgi:Bacterial Ig-like domain (group 2)/Divergent InlB B-repeat domain